MADQPSSRSRFQFRLRTLMIVVTLLAVVCPLGVRLFRRPVESPVELRYQDLVHAMNSMGGGVRRVTGDEAKRLRKLFSEESSSEPRADSATKP
jgi:hypothetical protein